MVYSFLSILVCCFTWKHSLHEFNIFFLWWESGPTLLNEIACLNTYSVGSLVPAALSSVYYLAVFFPFVNPPMYSLKIYKILAISKISRTILPSAMAVKHMAQYNTQSRMLTVLPSFTRYVRTPASILYPQWNHKGAAAVEAVTTLPRERNVQKINLCQR